MRRLLPDALLPVPRPTVAVAPLVQATVTRPVPSRLLEALAVTGSYEPNANAAVLLLQLLLTVALTVTLADALAADASDVFSVASTPVAAVTAATVRMIRLILIPSLLFERAHWFPNGLCGCVE